MAGAKKKQMLHTSCTVWKLLSVHIHAQAASAATGTCLDYIPSQCCHHMRPHGNAGHGSSDQRKPVPVPRSSMLSCRRGGMAGIV